MTSKTVVLFDDFAGGDFGRVEPARAPRNSFSARNMLVYPDGSLGPRYGVKQIVLTGTAPAAGLVSGLGYNFAADAAGFKDTWFTVGTAVYVFDRDTGANMQTATSIAATPAGPVQSIEWSVTSYLMVPGDKMYALLHDAVPDITALAAAATVFSPGMTCLAVYGDNVVAGGPGKAPDGTASPGNRLYWSDPQDPDTWAATNYLDVGDASNITALIPQRNHLVVCKGNGDWWIVTGTLGGTDVATAAALRIMVDHNIAPNAPEHACVLGDGTVQYAVGSSETGSVASLGRFTGSQVSLDPVHFFSDGRSGDDAKQPAFKLGGLKEQGDWLTAMGKQAGNTTFEERAIAARIRGVISRHSFHDTIVTDGFVASFVTADFHVFSVSTAGVAATMYRWRAYAVRPAFTTDAFGAPGDASTVTMVPAQWTTSDHIAPSGEEVLLRAVVVDFTRWNTGVSAVTNHFDLQAARVSGFEADDLSGTNPWVKASAVQSFDEAGAAVGATGVSKRKRVKFAFGDEGLGNGFRLMFTNVRGCTFHRVQALVETRPARLP